MFRLFYEGGPVFMGILTLLLLIVVVLSVRVWMKLTDDQWTVGRSRREISNIRAVGILALVVGVLGQLIGLYSALIAIEQMDGISPAMLAGGLRVSMITTIYGFVILVVSFLLWFLLGSRIPSDQ